MTTLLGLEATFELVVTGSVFFLLDVVGGAEFCFDAISELATLEEFLFCFDESSELGVNECVRFCLDITFEFGIVEGAKFCLDMTVVKGATLCVGVALKICLVEGVTVGFDTTLPVFVFVITESAFLQLPFEDPMDVRVTVKLLFTGVGPEVILLFIGVGNVCKVTERRS
mmetsp:Transcript_37174/g.42423  ORF Transcript_37174/g.42423 Transcript_37174/m.42423 type:complete len:170 (-) Transcript_37174:913-1422(-)